MLEEYEITSDTCALIGISENATEVIEKERRFTIFEKVNKVMNHSCQYYGCSLPGLIRGSQTQLRSKYKVPIILEDTNELVFFPTISPRLLDCCWISLKNISKYEKNNFGTLIEFKNDTKITVPISIESFENQIFRATQLMLIARTRRGLQK